MVDSSGKIKNPSMLPLYLLALLWRWQQSKSKKVQPSSDKELARLLGGILDALQQVVGASDSKGSADKVWELASMYSDVALTPVRQAALTWCSASPGISIPHDYSALSLRALYPGTQLYYSSEMRPLLESRLHNATRSVLVNEDEAVNTMKSILLRSASDMSSTVYKCQHQQCGFDSTKFLSPKGSFEPFSKQELVAVCKSSKFTGLASRRINLDKEVRTSLGVLRRAFDSAYDNAWQEWSGHLVLVVETNRRPAKKPETFLSAEESAMVISITINDHVDVYGRAISGFISHGPSLYGGTIAAIEDPSQGGERGAREEDGNR